MAYYEVNTSGLTTCISELNSIVSSLSSIQSQVQRVINSTRGCISTRVSMAINGVAIRQNISACSQDQKNLSAALHDAIQLYQQSEKRVLTGDYSLKTAKRKTKKSSGEKIKDFLDSFGKTVKKKAKEVKNKLVAVKKKVVNGIKNAWNKTKNAVKNTYEAVKGKVVTAIDYIKDSYNSQGWVYKTVQWGKAIGKTVGGVVKIATSVVALVGSYGTSTPLSVMAIISGFNDVANGVTDIVNCANNNYAEVGSTNYLKDGTVAVTGAVGKALGSEEIGEAVGKLAYTGFEITASIGSFQNATAAYTQSDFGKLTNIKTELKELPGMTKTLLNTDIKDLRVMYNLALKEIPDLMGSVEKVKNGIKVVSAGYGMVEKVKDTIFEILGKETTPASGLSIAKGSYDDWTGIPGNIEKINENIRIISEMAKLSSAH